MSAISGTGTCPRCRRAQAHPGTILEAPVCTNCFHKAARTYGTCPGCGADRLLPGLLGDQPACRDCAGIVRTFECNRCGAEGRLYRRKVCVRCRLDDLARERLEDETGAVRPELEALVPVLARHYTGTPQARWLWLRKPHVRALLAALAAGDLGLSHSALDRLPNQKQVAHLRTMLVVAGCLPEIDSAVHSFERFLDQRLAELTDHPHERLLRQFGAWHHLAKMRRKAQTQTLTPPARNYARWEFERAVSFCTWLEERDLTLRELSQGALDSRYGPLSAAGKQQLCGFLNWAVKTHRMPKLAWTRPKFRVGEALTPQQRLDLLRALLEDDEAALAHRIAGCVLLLFAQPITRILRLRVDDVLDEDEQLYLRLGAPPTPVPKPFADLLRRLAVLRIEQNVDWLLAGRSAGQPMSYEGLCRHLRTLGIPVRLAKTAAVRELVLEVPAPVVAAALGFHHTTTTRQVRNVGGGWSRYAAARQWH
ncbi:hypothetical protein AB0K15_47085 [Amycolatopsis sp. NPDC049253]|uniref:hypothetical protein n=1 Tax=Amycolatopsis sp. NPDC049253 TaxID=3155274 RepID=UPI00341FA6BD